MGLAAPMVGRQRRLSGRRQDALRGDASASVAMVSKNS